MKLLDDWKIISKKFWSFRLSIISALLGGAEVVTQLWHPETMPPGVFAGIAALVSIAAAFARIIAQPKAYDNGDK